MPKPIGPAPPPRTTSDRGTDGLGKSLELLAQVRAGTVPGTMLAPSDRQQLVVLMASDGLSTPEIAQILGISDRSVERDRRAIRESSAIPKDPKLLEQMVGRLMAEAELAVQRIRRAARDRDVIPEIKIDAEHRCFQIVRDLVQSLQRLGYLPTATQKVEADLTHHVGLPTFDELQGEIGRLKEIGGDSPDLSDLDAVVQRASAASHIKRVRAALPAEVQP